MRKYIDTIFHQLCNIVHSTSHCCTNSILKLTFFKFNKKLTTIEKKRIQIANEVESRACCVYFVSTFKKVLKIITFLLSFLKFSRQYTATVRFLIKPTLGYGL